MAVAYPTPEQLDELLRQMREEGKFYWDDYHEYLHGESLTYRWDELLQNYVADRIDIVALSYHHVDPLSEEQVRQELGSQSVHSLRQAGFNI